MNAPANTPDERRARRFCTGFGVAVVALMGAVMGLNLCLDPFGFRGERDTWPAGKREVAYTINKRLATLAEFESAPADHIILGDSRASHVSEDVLARAAGAPWRNLAFGGATLEEMTALYRHVSERRALRTVLLLVPFNRFTRTYSTNGVDEAVALTTQRWKLYASTVCLRASLAVTAFGLAGMRVRGDDAEAISEGEAHYQLQRERAREITMDGLQAATSILRELVREARAAGTRVVLVAPPVHPRVLEVYRTQFAEQFALFKGIASATTVFIDYERSDFEAELGAAVEFKDMFHLRKRSTDVLTRGIERRLAAHTP
jgi:hypothetical protein